MHSDMFFTKLLLIIIGTALCVALVIQGTIFLTVKTQPPVSQKIVNTSPLSVGTSLPLLDIPVPGGATRGKGNTTITNRDQWERLWQELSQTSNTPLPSVDFSTEMVIAVFSGPKPTGGYSTRIDSVNETEKEYRVFITEIKPANDCITSQAVTYPAALVKVAKSTKKTIYIPTTTTYSCQNDQGLSLE